MSHFFVRKQSDLKPFIEHGWHLVCSRYEPQGYPQKSKLIKAGRKPVTVSVYVASRVQKGSAS